MKRRVVVLFHAEHRNIQRNYMVDDYARFWREDGYEVDYVCGVDTFVPADVLLMHVDLSLVPDEYFEFARRYPVVINGAIKDIRKSGYSELRVQRGDGYEGPVIVKSIYNYAGFPERMLRVSMQKSRFVGAFKEPSDYLIAESPNDLTRDTFEDPNLIVERFLPEKEDDLYCTQFLVFLGDRVSCTKMWSKNPIVNGTNAARIEDVEPNPDVIALTKKLGFQYGKFDFVVHDGKATVLDRNKTVGGPPPSTDPKILAARRYRAEGLYSFFEGASAPA